MFIYILFDGLIFIQIVFYAGIKVIANITNITKFDQTYDTRDSSWSGDFQYWIYSQLNAYYKN